MKKNSGFFFQSKSLFSNPLENPAKQQFISHATNERSTTGFQTHKVKTNTQATWTQTTLPTLLVMGWISLPQPVFHLPKLTLTMGPPGHPWLHWLSCQNKTRAASSSEPDMNDTPAPRCPQSKDNLLGNHGRKSHNFLAQRVFFQIPPGIAFK